MKKLIIAEKPSLAKAVASAIGNMIRKDGYYEGSDYIVTFAFGHLFKSFDIEDYTKQDKAVWDLDLLPYYPDKFRFKLMDDPGIKKQFGIIKGLIDRSDVERVINCGDADREGEVIIRLILLFASNKKPVERLWLPDQMPATIISGLMNIKSDSEYDSLFKAGLCRLYLDWLYGINLTRYASVKAKGLMSVGRVITAVIKAIYDRDHERAVFVPEKYYKVEFETTVDGFKIVLSSGIKYSSEDDAREHAKRLNAAGKAVVKNITVSEKKKASGKLFSLSKLQGLLGKKYKMSPDETLAAAQSLYDKGYLTYPRTNSEYLAESEKARVTEIIDKTGADLKNKDSKRIYSDDKVESHSALTPTKKECDTETLSEKEKIVYRAVMNRFMAVFCSEECIISETVYEIAVGNEIFTVKGRSVNQKGWMKYEAPEKEDELLPDLKTGQEFPVHFSQAEKETKPPQKYTVESLLAYLSNPYAKDDDENDDEYYKSLKKGLEIGTEATRATIIGRAVKLQYISLKGNVYDITEKGKRYIDILNELGIDMTADKTVEFQAFIQSVYNSEMTVDDAVERSKKEIDKCFLSRDKEITGSIAAPKKEIGMCPLCGRPVTENKKAYGCSGFREGCSFTIWKSIKTKKGYGGRISAKQAEKILGRGYSDEITFKDKDGRTFKAVMKIKADKAGVEFMF